MYYMVKIKLSPLTFTWRGSAQAVALSLLCSILKKYIPSKVVFTSENRVVQFLWFRFPIISIGYPLSPSLVLKIFLSLLIHTPWAFCWRVNVFLSMKLHGTCKQDPLSASFSVGVKTERLGFMSRQFATTPVKTK